MLGCLVNPKLDVPKLLFMNMGLLSSVLVDSLGPTGMDDFLMKSNGFYPNSWGLSVLVVVAAGISPWLSGALDVFLEKNTLLSPVNTIWSAIMCLRIISIFPFKGKFRVGSIVSMSPLLIPVIQCPTLLYSISLLFLACQHMPPPTLLRCLSSMLLAASSYCWGSSSLTVWEAVAEWCWGIASTL